jgi:hypothetical protein
MPTHGRMSALARERVYFELALPFDYHLGFPTGLGPRVEDVPATGISGFYMSPYADLKLER